MPYLRGNLRQRAENEKPLVHPGMRHNEIGGGTDQVAVKQQVQINGSGTETLATNPPELPFHLEKHRQEFIRTEVGM
jgi:hypothetical protein